MDIITKKCSRAHHVYVNRDGLILHIDIGICLRCGNYAIVVDL